MVITINVYYQQELSKLFGFALLTRLLATRAKVDERKL